MINVIGLGYIGLPTALMFAKSGVKVTGTDIDENVIESLKKGILTFEEDKLPEVFEEAKVNIEFSTDYVKTDIYVVAVPTPYDANSKKINSGYITAVVDKILDFFERGAILIIESTVSPGTIDKYIRPEIEKKGFVIGEDLHLAHAPERVIPGKMIYELEYNSRTIGVDDIEVGEKLRDLYAVFCKEEIIITDIRSAEMSKVVENTFRDINIAFANELAKICRSGDGMNVYEIIRIANMHPRVDILQPGPGVGGHCISVDPWFLVGDYPDLTNMILTARKTNDSMPSYVLKRISHIMKEHNIKDISKIGLYGLTYKENVEDTRESPTLQLIEQMEDHLAFGVKVFDPLVKDKIVENQYLNFDEFMTEIELIVIMVAHDHIKIEADSFQDKIILDTRNIYSNGKVYKL